MSDTIGWSRRNRYGSHLRALDQAAERAEKEAQARAAELAALVHLAIVAAKSEIGAREDALNDVRDKIMVYLSGQTARVCAIAIGFGPCLMAAEGMAYREVLVIAQDAWKSACADALSASLEDRQSIATDEYGAKA